MTKVKVFTYWDGRVDSSVENVHLKFQEWFKNKLYAKIISHSLAIAPGQCVALSIIYDSVL